MSVNNSKLYELFEKYYSENDVYTKYTVLLEYSGLFLKSYGNRYAIVEETGSGKSTIIKLIYNLYRPTEGQINIYGKGCTDALIAEYISVVFQDTFLINGTIRDNIIFYRDDVSQSRLDDIIRICCLDELVSKLCDGLDMYIGENGVMLSGGERQRIGIARALVQNKPVTKN